MLSPIERRDACVRRDRAGRSSERSRVSLARFADPGSSTSVSFERAVRVDFLVRRPSQRAGNEEVSRPAGCIPSAVDAVRSAAPCGGGTNRYDWRCRRLPRDGATVTTGVCAVAGPSAAGVPRRHPRPRRLGPQLDANKQEVERCKCQTCGERDLRERRSAHPSVRYYSSVQGTQSVSPRPSPVRLVLSIWMFPLPFGPIFQMTLPVPSA